MPNRASSPEPHAIGPWPTNNVIDFFRGLNRRESERRPKMCKTSEALQPRVEKFREEVVMKTFGNILRMNQTLRRTKGAALVLAIAGLCGCAGNVPEPPPSTNSNATL